MFAVMYTAPLPVFLGSLGDGKAFLPPVKKMDQLVERMAERRQSPAKMA